MNRNGPLQQEGNYHGGGGEGLVRYYNKDGTLESIEYFP